MHGNSPRVNKIGPPLREPVACTRSSRSLCRRVSWKCLRIRDFPHARTCPLKAVRLGFARHDLRKRAVRLGRKRPLRRDVRPDGAN